MTTLTQTTPLAVPRPNMRTLTLVLMTGVLLLAAVFRIYHITQQSIWFDEAFAWNIIIQDDMFPRIAADTHPPLYYVLLRAWGGVAGDSPLALRYLSALISLGTVAVLYQVGRELIRTQREPRVYAPVLAALVLALTDAEIFLAQETRNYALYSFFATLSMWLYLRWQRRGGLWAGLAWAGSTTALVYTHYQGVFIPAVQGLHVLLFLRGRVRWQAIGYLALSGLAFLPWFVGVTIPQAQNAIDNSLPFSIPTNLETLLHLRDNYLGAQWPLMLVLALVGLVGLARHNAFLIGLWFALPFGVLFFGNLFAELLTERKLLVVAPAIALLVGVGLARMPSPARWLLAAAIIIYGASAVDYYREKEPWAQITGSVVPYVQPDHLAMMEIGVGQYPVKYYWGRTLPEETYITTFPVLGDYTMAPTTDWPTYYDAFLPQVLETVKAEADDVATAWLVFWSQNRTMIDRLEEADYQRTMTIPFNHLGNPIDIYRYDHLPESTLATYEPGLTLHAADIDAPDLRVDLWWSLSDAPVGADYTTSVLLLDENEQVVAQLDSSPPRPTSQWGQGDLIFDPKPLATVDGQPLPPGTYTAVAQVYQWTPEGIINFTTSDGERWYTLGTVDL